MSSFPLIGGELDLHKYFAYDFCQKYAQTGLVHTAPIANCQSKQEMIDPNIQDFVQPLQVQSQNYCTLNSGPAKGHFALWLFNANCRDSNLCSIKQTLPVQRERSKDGHEALEATDSADHPTMWPHPIILHILNWCRTH